MPAMEVIIRADLVNAYLEEHGLAEGNVPIEALLVQDARSCESGRPQIMLVINVDGRRVVAKTTLRLLNAALAAVNAVHGE